MSIGVFGLTSPRVSSVALRNPPSTFLSTFSALLSLSPLPAHRPRLYQHSLEPLSVVIICNSVPLCRVIAADPRAPCYTPYCYDLSSYRHVACSPPLSGTHPLLPPLSV